MGPALVPFTINFTVTNLFYTPDMGHRGSEKFNFTEKVLNHLVRALQSLCWPALSSPHPAPWLLPLISLSPPPQLGPLLKNTSVGPLYSNCRLTLLR